MLFRSRLFANSEERLEDAYQRYLVKGVHEEFDLAGVPVFLDIVGKPKQAGRRPGASPVGDPAAAVVHKPSAKPVTRPTPAVAGPRVGKVRATRGPAKPAKKAYSRWEKPRSLKGRAARQARK